MKDKAKIILIIVSAIAIVWSAVQMALLISSFFATNMEIYSYPEAEGFSTSSLIPYGIAKPQTNIIQIFTIKMVVLILMLICGIFAIASLFANKLKIFIVYAASCLVLMISGIFFTNSLVLSASPDTYYMIDSIGSGVGIYLPGDISCMIIIICLLIVFIICSSMLIENPVNNNMPLPEQNKK